MPFHEQVVCVVLAWKRSGFTASGGKYTLPSTTSYCSLSASTLPFHVALAMVCLLAHVLPRRPGGRQSRLPCRRARAEKVSASRAFALQDNCHLEKRASQR